MGYSLGVDLGTTFVAAATAQGSRAEMFTLGDRTVVMPASVYLGDDDTLVTGHAAERRAIACPDRVGRYLKRRLGDVVPMILGGAAFHVTTLLAALLRDVVEHVAVASGSAPDRAWSSPTRRAGVRFAGSNSGRSSSSLACQARAWSPKPRL